MKLKRFWTAAVLVAVGLAANVACALNDFYAKMTVQPSSTAAGLVYATNETDLAEASLPYAASSTGYNHSSSGGGTVNIYGYAMPKFGYKFTSWSQSGTDTWTSRSRSFSGSVSSSGVWNRGASNAKDWGTYTANFSAVTVTDVHLHLNDSIQFNFHNGTSAAWITRLNEAFVTGTSAASGRHVSVMRSTNDSTTDFAVTVTGSSASGSDSPDQLAIIDKDNNTYCYNVYVHEARTVEELSDLTFAVTSTVSKAWSRLQDTDAKVATNTFTSAASTVTTVKVHGVAAGTTTLILSNYASSSTDAEKGVVYSCALTVTEKAPFAHYAMATAQVAGSGGQAYVSASAYEAVDSYATAQTSAGPISTSSKYDAADVGPFYLYAMPDFGYKFAGWSKGSSSNAATIPAAQTNVTVSSSATTAKTAPADAYYAHFTTTGAGIQDVTLAVGDTVRFYFYNTVKGIFSARVNETFLTEKDTAQAGAYATYARSWANTTAVNQFSVLVTATAASGTGYDALTVQDHLGRVYHYRVFVTEARTVYKGKTLPVTVYSIHDAEWTASSADTAHVTTMISPSGVATNEATVTLRGVAVTDEDETVSITASNYANTSSDGPQGAVYTLKTTVTDPPKNAFYARVDTVVPGGASSAKESIGAGWAYVSTIRQENSDNYKTLRSESSVLENSTYDTTATSLPVSGFYLFAFPNIGYKFTGWSLGDPEGPIVLTNAYFATEGGLAVTATSTNAASPTVYTYYAHFERDESTVQDVYLSIGDSVRLSFYNDTACNWSLQVVYTNGNDDVVVNLDDVAAHAGGYANYTRSHTVAPADASNTFSMLVEATTASGTGYDELTIEDYEGRVYHYRVHVADRRVIEEGQNVSLSARSHASNAWTLSGDVSSYVTASLATAGATNAASVTVTGVLKGKTSFSASNYAVSATTGPLGAAYTFEVNLVRPHRVEFCEGDQVVIYYHNNVAKNWYLLINGNRFEPNVAGTGEQMTVTLTAENPDTDTEILGTTTHVGDGTSSDLVIVTDGENFYAYRMSVSPRRVIGLGESASMTCSTVSTNAWRYQVTSSASRYVDVAFDSFVNEGHSSTITATGKQPGKDVILYVANFKNDDTVNAKGALYTLVLDVVGAYTRGAYVSRGTSVTWGETCDGWTNGMSFTVSPAVSNLMTAAIASNADAAVYTTLAVPSNAVNYSKALFTVKDETGKDVVKYDVMAYSWMSMAVGQVAPGCLTGSEVPWVVESSDPDKLSVEPVLYNALNSARVEALAPGDFHLWATNGSDKVDWYVIRAKVYDEVDRIVALAPGAATNLEIAATVDLASLWSVTSLCSDVTATLDNATTAVRHVTLALDAGTTEGLHQVKVTGDYHHELINVYVGDDGADKTIVIGESNVVVSAGNTIDLPAECTTAAWTATASGTAAGIFTVAASGAANQRATVTGVKPGTGQVIVKTGTTIYVYEVEVSKYDGALHALTLGIGYTVTTNVTTMAEGLAQGATLVSTPDSMVATAYLVGNTLTVTGVQDGRTRLQLATDTYLYTLEIIVHERKIRKDITLYVGEDGSYTTYSYTFDQLLSYQNLNPDRVNVETNGTTVTFIPNPGADGIAQVSVECFVDNLEESSTLIYGITIKQEKAGYKVRNYGAGYVAYRDADVVAEIGDDLVFVFTNTSSDALGSLRIPDGYSARADILAIGGGGGGGSVATGFGRGGGGGGAGGFYSVTNKKLSAGSFFMSVGKKGLGLARDVGGNVSLRGSNGGDSVITNAFGYGVAYANGGGGGGAPSAANYSGESGGSGGGGSWIEDANGVLVAGRGGLGVNGQGCNGGTPDQENSGGGGGGAGSVGGSGQRSGDGKASDITGTTVTYCTGGYGGRCDETKQAASGAEPGDGGGGGNGGAGGDGSSGLIAVRFHKLFQNVLVPVPTTNDLITARFLWEEGTNCVPFVYAGRTFRSVTDSHPYDYEDVIASVTGVTNVLCTLGGDGGTNKVGVGYYNFRVALKDGFAWDDGSDYGDTEKMSYRWVICAQWSDIDADIAVDKTVWWSDKSNATIRVNSVASPETSGGGIPKVLFIGSLCGAHGFSSDILNTALNTVTKVGDVDYYFFNRTTQIPSTVYREDDPPFFSGSLLLGETRTGTVYAMNPNDSNKTNALENVDGNHGTMAGFYHQIYCCMTNGTASTYDYIIFSFDRARLAERFEGAFEHEAEVAAFLAPYYAGEKVIWLVDDQNDSKAPISQTPWYPSPLTEFMGTSKSYWESLDYGVVYWDDYSPMSTWVSDGTYGYVPYNALVGLMCPSNYPVNVTTYKNNLLTDMSGSVAWTDDTLQKVANLACASNRNQCVYNNASNVADLIASTVRVKPFNLYYQDKIVSPAEGLTIQSVSIMVTREGDGTKASTNESDWVQLMHWDTGMASDEFIYDDATHATGIPGASMTVDISSNLVSAVISNIDFRVYVRYDTHVLDAEGKFQQSDGANYNESTGQYEKNPNEGTAYLSMINELGIGIGVEGDAETQVPWRYTAYTITGDALNGNVYVAGTSYRSLACAEGRDVTVYYRGNGGYRLVALEVDGNEIELTADNENGYTFENLSADHYVEVVYEAYYGTVTPVDTVYEYDGSAHVPDVELKGWDATYSTEIRYSLTTNGPYYTEAEFKETYSTNRDVTCVGDHEVFCRVYALQPGYGATMDESGWVWVDTRVVEEATVTITQKPLVITANSFKLSAEEAPETSVGLHFWRGVTVDGLVAGDVVNTNSAYLEPSCPTYAKEIGQYRLDPVYAGTMTAYDVAGSNYVVYLRPGAVSVIRSPMIIGGIDQSGFLDPEAVNAKTGVDRVEKVYDGVETNLVIRIDEPFEEEETKKLSIKYSTDDGATWTTTLPTSLHVGTNKVWYAVEYDVGAEQPLYFWVTNYNYVIVNPRPLVFTAASATKVYDTHPLSTNGYALTSGTIAAGDELAAITVAGRRTNVGTSPNVVSGAQIKNGFEYRTSDYAITYVDGALTVTPGAITIGDKTYEPGAYVPYGETGVEDVEKVYDGIGTNILVDVVTPSSGYTVYYTTNSLTDPNVVWSETLSITNAGTNVVHFIVEAPNYATVTNFARVTISPRPLTVTAIDAQARAGQTPEYKYVVTDDATGEVVSDEVLAQLNVSIGSPEYVAALDDPDVSNLGTFPIVPSGAAVQGNYSLTYVNATLTTHAKETIGYTAPDVTAPYDGRGHAITVTVTNNPAIATTVEYALSPDGPWTSASPVVTNATNGLLVYYRITPEDTATYQTATGSAMIKVTPLTVTVTSVDQEKLLGEDDPEFTTTVTGLLDGEGTNLLSYAVGRAAGESAGSYVIGLEGEGRQGNYVVNYVPGTLTIVGFSEIWICDHDDAGPGKVHLAFSLTFTSGAVTTNRVLRLANAGRIKAAKAATQEALATASLVPAALRDPTALLDLDKGWIWVTVDLDETKPLWKIVIDNP